ncbi:WYL domain-containing protein [Streptomyces sp. NPDC006617]|uniref:WYL domain-containing protein n=1 Tax=Streptomyces sp. NPDC006617 TaxID=3155354 RepID=UPI0033AFC62F
MEQNLQSLFSGASRRAEHHHLVTWRHRWYLVAFDLARDDWRTSASTASGPAPPGPRFTTRELPGGDVSTFIASRFRGNDGTTTGWPCRGDVILPLTAADITPFAQDAVVEELRPPPLPAHPRLLVLDRTRLRPRALRHRRHHRRSTAAGRRLRRPRRPIHPRRGFGGRSAAVRSAPRRDPCLSREAVDGVRPVGAPVARASVGTAQSSCAFSHRRTSRVTGSVMSANSSCRFRNFAT